MQQNFRQLGLQNIIKIQQEKIFQLKQQLRTANDRQQYRYSELTQGLSYQIQQKDKMIEYLKKQVKKLEENKSKDIDISIGIVNKDKDKLKEDIVTLKTKLQQAQNKITKLQTQNEVRVKQLNDINRSLLKQYNEAVKTKNNFFMQYEQLNFFYKNAVVQLPKRKQTLLWVDNLIQYMQKTQQTQKQSAKQLNSYVKNSLETLKSEILNNMSKAQKNETDIENEVKKLQKSFGQFITESKKSNDSIMNENETFWQKIKKQKENINKEQVLSLKNQINFSKEKHAQQVTQLKNNIRSLQVEKKTLLLGFQQLKNLNESREKTYKQEINLLKEAIADLLKSAQSRQSQFQSEISHLGTQIEAISQRYYENIQSPSKRANQLLICHFDEVKFQLCKLQENNLFKNTLQKLTESLKQLTNPQNTQSLSNNLQKHLKQCAQTLRKIQNKINFHEQTLIYQNQGQGNNTVNNSMKQMRLQIKMIQSKQRQNKYHYELNLLKKQNAKLQQHCSLQQKRLQKIKLAPKQLPKVIQLQKKITKLESQRDALKYQNERIQLQVAQQIRRAVENTNLLSSQIQRSINQPKNYTKVLNLLREQNKEITFKMNQFDQKIVEISQVMNILNNLLVKPVQTFQLLIKQAINMKESFSPSSQISAPQTKRNWVSTIDQLSKYRQIILKRQQNNINTQKCVNELMKTIRETIPQKQKLQSLGVTQLQQKEKGKSRLSTNYQKKMKQIQSQRIKDKQDLTTFMQNMQSSLKKIQQKCTKKGSIQFIKQFQNLFDKRIQLISKQINTQKGYSQFSKITCQALKDMEAKLKTVIIENEGIVKQMALQQKLNKSQ